MGQDLKDHNGGLTVGHLWVGASYTVREDTGEMSDGELEAWVRTLGWNEGTQLQQMCTQAAGVGRGVLPARRRAGW